MWRGFYTLRFRLAALNMLVFGLIIVVLSVVLLRVREKTVRRDFDEWLKEVAQSIVDEIAIYPDDLMLLKQGQPRPRLDPFHFPGFYFQLRSPDGLVLERSRSLKGLTLPMSEHAAHLARQAKYALETVSGGIARDLLGPDEPLRLLTSYQVPRGQDPYFLQIGVSLSRINESVVRLYRVFMVLIPVALLLVGLGSWLMARRSLAPIGRVARETRELTVANFDRRIPVPRGKDEVSEMVVTINGMLDRLRAGFRAHERFIADAAHELKTPVAVLLGEAQVLSRQARSPEEYDHFVTGVESEMRRLSQILDSLLTLARANAGFPISLATPVSLNDVVTEAVARCSAQANQREVRLVPRLWLPGPKEPEPIVKGDEDLLCSLVVNLVRNAVRNSPAGGPVETELDLAGEEIRIAVRDGGPGIPEEFVERIFDEFFRIPGRDSSAGVAGLGLAIAKGIAQLHGGSISVANLPGGGCEFVVRLPLCPPDEKTLI